MITSIRYLFLHYSFSIIFFSNVYSQNFNVKPYLQNVTPSSIHIMWETTSNDESTVHWGETTELGYTSTGNVTLNGFEYYFVIQDPSIISTTAALMSNLSGTSRQFLQEQDIPFAQQYGFNGNSFTINPIQQDKAGNQTNVYVVHVETGAYNSFTVTNNITKNQRAILSTVRSGT